MKYLTAFLWIPAIAVKILLVAVGLPVVAIAIAQRGRQSRVWPSIFWLWGNDEDGCPVWWKGSAWWWYAIRNPVNNFRYLVDDVDLADCEIETNWDLGLPMEAPQMLEAGQGMAYCWIRHGWKSGYRRVWINGGKYSEAWFGWKLGSEVPGLGFTTQLRLNREIGK